MCDSIHNHYHENYVGECDEECLLDMIRNASTDDEKRNAIHAYNDWKSAKRTSKARLN